jgi:hypothetical protein
VKVGSGPDFIQHRAVVGRLCSGGVDRGLLCQFGGESGSSFGFELNRGGALDLVDLRVAPALRRWLGTGLDLARSVARARRGDAP